MNLRFTLIVFLVFVAAAVFLYTQRDREPTRVGPGAPTETPESILSLDAGDVQEVAVVGASGAYTLTRVAGGWEVDDQPAGTEVDSVVTSLANPTVLRVLPEDRDPNDYGFATPSLTVTLRTAAGDAHILHVGDDAPADPQVYVRLGGAGRIVLIGDYDVNRLKDWLTEPPLAPTETPDVTETPEGTAEPVEDETPSATDAEPEDEDGTGTPEAPEETAEPTEEAEATDTATATVTTVAATRTTP